MRTTIYASTQVILFQAFFLFLKHYLSTNCIYKFYTIHVSEQFQKAASAIFKVSVVLVSIRSF